MLTAMLGSRYRGRRMGVSIRDGSVREARLSAGLSLAGIAGKELSRTAIHLIEHGRVKPSRETLRLIARRTRQPMSYFLPATAAPVAALAKPIAHLERLTTLRDFPTVIATGTSLLSKRWRKADAVHLHFFLGQAHCRLVQPTEALEHLVLARRGFEELDDDVMVVETIDWEAAALGLLESTSALSVALEALDRCRHLEPVPAQTEARILGHIAGLYVVRHSWSTAVRYYEESVAVAGRIKDLLQMAKMHHGLGGALKRMGQPAEARAHYERALILYSLESEEGAIYRVENDLGDLLLKEGQLESAEIHLRKALAGCDAIQLERRGRGFILLGLGELYFRRNDYASAREYLDEAMNSAAAVGEQIVTAEAHVLFGQLEERLGRTVSSDRHFGDALQILGKLGMTDRVRDCHMEYANTLDARGDLRGAADHWKAAAEAAKFVATGASQYGQVNESVGEVRTA